MRLARLALLAVVALAGQAIAASAAPPVLDRSVAAASLGGPDVTPAVVLYAPNACSDRAYSLLGGHWTDTLEWSFKASSIPAGLDPSDLLSALMRSFDNMIDARNDCGLPDTVGATAQYLGQTGYAPSVTGRGHCAASDGRNVIGFGRLPAGTLAVTCVRNDDGGAIVEADIRINSNVDWSLSPSSCSFEELLEPTMTHEIGHAFGLGHVSESRHGRLTMSTYSDGVCSDAESTLGLGDIRGLGHLYPLP